MFTGRYPFKSTFGFRSKNTFGSSFRPLVGALREDVNTQPFISWWFGDDGITPSNVFDKGFVVLKRWTGTQWVSARSKIKKY